MRKCFLCITICKYEPNMMAGIFKDNIVCVCRDKDNSGQNTRPPKKSLLQKFKAHHTHQFS